MERRKRSLTVLRVERAYRKTDQFRVKRCYGSDLGDDQTRDVDNTDGGECETSGCGGYYT